VASIKVHGGDFLTQPGHFSFGTIRLMTKEHSFLGEAFSCEQLASLEIVTEANVKRLGGTIGWGAVGAVALGPVGLLAGLLSGGRKTEVTFLAAFKDGRKFLGTTDAQTYAAILGGFTTAQAKQRATEPPLPPADARQSGQMTKDEWEQIKANAAERAARIRDSKEG
jgi:hypothetical protein